MTSVIILALVFILIAVRQVGRLRFQIWHAMLLGALAVLATGQISPRDALHAINLDVILFLFGMFVVGHAFEDSGYLSHLAYEVFSRTRTTGQLVLLVLFGMGFASAFLMNDTLAIIGTPVMLHFARRHGLSPKLLLLALAFAVTIGSVPSPIGNPQNLLIALGGRVESPFLTFLRHLALPSVINLFACYILLRVFYRREFHSTPLDHEREPLNDARLALLSRISLAVLGVLILAKIAVVSLRLPFDFRLTYIALASAAPILLFSGRRTEILCEIDWRTLIFFAAMFVLMESVWRGGFFQDWLHRLDVPIASTGGILLVSVVLSQFISNVPLVALCLPMLLNAGVSTDGLMVLAAGSTIAGNLSILGAASNVIIIQNAEKRGETLTFWEFARIGIPLTAVNVLVHWLFARM